MGYRMKPLGYKIANWTWLISKLERRLDIWYHKYLSRAGRLVLIKVVLEATPVYWMSLAWIPWAKWDLLSIPKKWGGWGIKNWKISPQH